MKKYYLILMGFVFGFTGAVNAQDSVAYASDSVHSKVDVQPEFPGGWKELGKIVDGRRNHYYPKEARANKIEGKVVVEFIINADGTPSDFKVVQGIGYGCDEAAVEAFKKMPKWKPAMVNGKPVKVKRQMGYIYKM